MKIKLLSILIIALSIFSMTSCHVEEMFEQPSITVTDVKLKELPGEYTHLLIDTEVTNNDDREVTIKDVEYTVEIEGATSEIETEDIGKEIVTGEPLKLTLPLTLKTKDAIALLAKLDAGKKLNYSAIGTFHVAEGIPKLFDLPLDVQGEAEIKVGFESFYIQPEVTVSDIDVSYKKNDDNTYTFDFDVACSAKNKDTRGVTIEDIEYKVKIENILSKTHFYSDTYSTDLVIAVNETKALNLPVSLKLNQTEGATLAQAIENGTINYTVEGTFQVIKINDTNTDFLLPLYLTGSISGDVVSDLFAQPTIEVTGYTLKELPGEFTYLDIDIRVTNNDTREALISDVSYQVVIEGVTSAHEQVDINKSILVGTPLELTLPVTLVTDEAIQLLTILDSGQGLNYSVTGTFHVDEPVINVFNLPIDIQGTATVDVGFEEFFNQPEITVNDISGTYSSGGVPVPTSYTFDLDVNSDVKNLDSHSVIIDEIEYVVYIEGKKSETHYYSNAYSSNLTLAGNETKPLVLPVTLILNGTQGAELISDMADGSADYIIEGTFHAIDVEGNTTDFVLPLYSTGTVPISVVAE